MPMRTGEGSTGWALANLNIVFLPPALLPFRHCAQADGGQLSGELRVACCHSLQLILPPVGGPPSPDCNQSAYVHRARALLRANKAARLRKDVAHAQRTSTAVQYRSAHE